MDKTQEFTDFCTAMADAMNENQECNPVTVDDVKAMPEAVDAFVCTLAIVDVAERGM